MTCFFLRAGLCCMLISCSFQSFAQCAKGYTFSSWSKVSGKTNSVGSTYKYANVATNIDAYITIIDSSNRGHIVNFDQTSGGYGTAWQPIINLRASKASGQSARASWVEFLVEFKSGKTQADTMIPCITLGMVDVDGESTGLNYTERVSTKGFTSYQLINGSSLSFSNSNGFFNVDGISSSFNNIDTLNVAAMAQANFQFVKNITLRLGTVRTNNTNGTTNVDRQFSLFFKSFVGLNVTQLPVDYTKFDAVVEGPKVNLLWQTATEKNNQVFEIERKEMSSMNYVKVGEVAGHGTTNDVQNYSFADVVTPGTYSYRLKQIDFNGEVSYSFSKVVVINSNKPVAIAYPNPFTGNISLTINALEEGKANIAVVDIMGHTVYTKSVDVYTGLNTVDCETAGANLATGMYFVVVENGGEKQTFRLQKQ